MTRRGVQVGQGNRIPYVRFLFVAALLATSNGCAAKKDPASPPKVLPIKFEDIKVVGGPLVRSTDAEVDEVEKELGVTFPNGYREYVTRFGEGILGGSYVRIYPPRRILNGSNNVKEWRGRIKQYWFWDEGSNVLSKDRALESIILGDTMDGDEIVFHPSQPDRLLILPRHHEAIFEAGKDLYQTLSWLCSSGVLTAPFAEREFEPFDSRKP